MAMGVAALALGCPRNPGAAPTPDPAEIERRNYEAILDDTLCPCGAPHTLRTCLATHDACPSRVAAGKMAARLVADGLARTEIVEAIAARFKSKPVPLRLDGAPCKGVVDARITIVEFADFECPHCKDVTKLWKPLLDRYPADLRICFKNYPLTAHPNAEIAARAAMAAAEGGKFWEMHDLIFEHQTELGLDKLVTLARTLGFEEDPFMTALSSEAVRTRVESDRTEGEIVGVRSTPTLFINGVRFTERRREAALRGWIEDALVAARLTPPPTGP